MTDDKKPMSTEWADFLSLVEKVPPQYQAAIGNAARMLVESEVRLALAPREQSPEFEAAEVALHICVDSLQRAKPELYLHRRRCKPIADELDRRAAEIARLTAITEHCRECGVAFSERAEMADTGLCVTCEGKRDSELERLREFARKVREAERLSMGPSEYANRIAEALDELAAPTKEPTK
jgi:hypothetical protein